MYSGFSLLWVFFSLIFGSTKSFLVFQSLFNFLHKLFLPSNSRYGRIFLVVPWMKRGPCWEVLGDHRTTISTKTMYRYYTIYSSVKSTLAPSSLGVYSSVISRRVVNQCVFCNLLDQLKQLAEGGEAGI